MKRRIKLISSIFSLTLAMVFMSFGVYAAATRSVTISSKITFNAVNVAATVTVSHALTGGGTVGVLDPTTGIAEFKVSDSGQSDKSVDLGITTFSDTTTKYAITVVIKSDFPANGRDITVVAPLQTALASGLPKGVTVAIANTVGPLTGGKLTANASTTYVITYAFAAAGAANFSEHTLNGIAFSLSV